MFSTPRQKTHSLLNRRLNTVLWYLHKKCLAAQAQIGLLAAAAATASGKTRLGWAVRAQLGGSLCPQPLLLPSSLLSSTPNRRTSVILPFLFSPYAQHSSQTEPCLSFPPGSGGLPFPRMAVLGREDEGGGWVVVQREAAPWVGATAHMEGTWMCMCTTGCSLPQGQEKGSWNLYLVPACTMPRLPFFGEIFRITK